MLSECVLFFLHPLSQCARVFPMAATRSITTSVLNVANISFALATFIPICGLQST